jgi:hypothetical protein
MAGLSSMISIARLRIASGGILALADDEFHAIVPMESSHYTGAVQLLSDSGFRVP